MVFWCFARMYLFSIFYKGNGQLFPLRFHILLNFHLSFYHSNMETRKMFSIFYNAFHCYVYPHISFSRRSTFNAGRVTQLSRNGTNVRTSKKFWCRRVYGWLRSTCNPDRVMPWEIYIAVHITMKCFVIFTHDIHMAREGELDTFTFSILNKWWSFITGNEYRGNMSAINDLDRIVKLNTNNIDTSTVSL